VVPEQRSLWISNSFDTNPIVPSDNGLVSGLLTAIVLSTELSTGVWPKFTEAACVGRLINKTLIINAHGGISILN
jgi:hypothetical protein